MISLQSTWVIIKHLNGFRCFGEHVFMYRRCFLLPHLILKVLYFLHHINRAMEKIKSSLLF